MLKEELFDTLPEESGDDLLPLIRAELADLRCSIIVLDDDPTGTQTVYDTPLLTAWDADSIYGELTNETPLFYILTNSRSLSPDHAVKLAEEIGKIVSEASGALQRRVLVISRSDSTLRGHYPEEVDALTRSMGLTQATQVLIPAFWEGGRYTINDTHYLEDGDELIPVGSTPFARDQVFGYKHSKLNNWVEEKTKGRIKSHEVVSVLLKDIRRGGPDATFKKIIQCPENGVCIVNAATRQDLDIVALAILRAISQGKNLLLRTAASIIPAIAGLSPKPLLTGRDLGLQAGGGLTIVGSYVPKSSAQLAYLKDHWQAEYLEVPVDHLLDEDGREKIVLQMARHTDQLLEVSKHVVLYTSRKQIRGKDKADSLDIGRKVSEALVGIVKAIKASPGYILAKGGITSNDIASKALGIRRAMVKGQILPGIPVWELETEGKYNGIPYIVFPGNVGGEEALFQVIQKLTGCE